MFRTSALSTGTRRSRGTDFIGPGFARIASQHGSGLSPTNNKQRSRVVRNDVDDRFSQFVNFVVTLLVVCGTYGVTLAENGVPAARRLRRKGPRFISSISKM